MNCKCQLKCDWINDFDMFGKRVELYYKGRSKKASSIGLIFTSLYIVLFLVLFLINKNDKKNRSHYLRCFYLCK